MFIYSFMPTLEETIPARFVIYAIPPTCSNIDFFSRRLLSVIKSSLTPSSNNSHADSKIALWSGL